MGHMLVSPADDVESCVLQLKSAHQIGLLEILKHRFKLKSPEWSVVGHYKYSRQIG